MTADATPGLTIRMLTVCRTCRVGWPEGGAPTCADPVGHTHVPYETHVHRTPVSLPKGAELWAVSYDADDPYTRDLTPDFGLYLDDRWAPPWDHARVAWPDFGVPADLDELRARLTEVLARATAGERVEIGCLGAHGRTGTALACLAVVDGLPPDDAVTWVRTAYCPRAVETPEQAAFVQAFRPT
jgi:hypothetical protein